jgi:hypothetical protein
MNVGAGMQTSTRVYFEFAAGTFAVQNNGEVIITSTLCETTTDKCVEHWYDICVVYELCGSQRLTCKQGDPSA